MQENNSKRKANELFDHVKTGDQKAFELLFSIRHERKVELANEGNRYWDVRRWRTVEVELSKPLSSIKFILDFTTRKFKLQIIPNIDGSLAQAFSPRHYYLPISLTRTTNNPNLVENPGY